MTAIWMKGIFSTIVHWCQKSRGWEIKLYRFYWRSDGMRSASNAGLEPHFFLAFRKISNQLFGSRFQYFLFLTMELDPRRIELISY